MSPLAIPKEPPLSRLGRAASRRRRPVLVAWLLLLVVAIVVGPKVAGDWSVDYGTPGSDSKAVEQSVAKDFPGATLDSLLVTWKAPGGVKSPAAEAHVREVLAQMSAIDNVSDADLQAARTSPDGKYGFLEVPLEDHASTVALDQGADMLKVANAADGAGVTMRFGGQVMTEAERGAVSSEGVGLSVALIILLLTFGTVIAAGLPLAVALFGIGTGSALVGLIANVVDTPDWASSVAVMVGIGVGIDYALLILTRYRSALRAGARTDDAIAYAMGTAGRSVVVAGGTVVISMLGLLLMGLPYLVGVAFAASVSVLTVMLASITLLPALLGFAGPRIERLRVPLPGARRRAAAAAVATDRDLAAAQAGATHDGSPRFAAWSRTVQRRPWVASIAALVVLVAIASPVAGVRLGFPGAQNDPVGTQSREASELMTEGFGAGVGGPLQVLAPIGGADGKAKLEALGARIAKDPRVALVSPVTPSQDGELGLMTVQSRTSPTSAKSTDLLNAVRDEYVPGSGVAAKVGGWTAQTRDQSVATADRLPLLFLGVAGLSSLLLLVAFRSILIPIKAAVLNLLSIFAAYGVVAAVAEGGAFGQLFGINGEVPIPPFIPVLMFAILFGLSMDYEVFLVGRIRELWATHGDASRAVTEGLSATARVITAAAAIMIAVFGAFALDDQVFLKLIGIGLASAILIDATVIRLFLVPALMELMGERAWRLPGWLDRRLPHTSLEGTAELPVAAESPRTTQRATPVAAGDAG
ncbi:MAG: MMPL family transporter [Solirubrobacteraceae bacterium]|nr:MMPL family transporter [Solirubrobacteraceae bacterium]